MDGWQISSINSVLLVNFDFKYTFCFTFYVETIQNCWIGLSNGVSSAKPPFLVDLYHFISNVLQKRNSEKLLDSGILRFFPVFKEAATARCYLDSLVQKWNLKTKQIEFLSKSYPTFSCSEC